MLGWDYPGWDPSLPTPEGLQCSRQRHEDPTRGRRVGTVPSACAPGHPCTFELQQSEFWVAAWRPGGSVRAHPSSGRVQEAAALCLGMGQQVDVEAPVELGWCIPGSLDPHVPQPHSGNVGVCKADRQKTSKQRGGILIHMALEAKFLSWPWRVGVELLPSSAVPLAQGHPKIDLLCHGWARRPEGSDIQQTERPPRCLC